MTQHSHHEHSPVLALRMIAFRYPEVQEGIVCTKAAFKARNKAFLFIGVNDGSYNTLLKLREALPEAVMLAAHEPNRFQVGGHGWVSATFRNEELPPPGLFERWIDESYRLLAPKSLTALLTERGLPADAPTTIVGRKQARRHRPPDDSTYEEDR